MLTTVAARASTGFSDNFNRSDRELSGDNGWYSTNISPNNGHYAIVSNRFRALLANSGVPGGSGTIGAPIAHSGGTPADPDVVDVSFDIVAGGITGLNGSYLWFVMAATQNAASPPTINSGVVMEWFLDTTLNQMHLGKITATNATTAHNPATFPACPANATTTVRMVLVRSTGTLKVYINGTLQHTSTAGHYSGLTGNIIAFQQQFAYSSTPYEIDNVIAV